MVRASAGPVLADFAGRWRLTRRIEDRGAGPDGTFEGEAVFDGTGPLWYREVGRLRLGERAMTAEQRHIWTQDSDGIAVAFADNRPFHRIAPGLAPEVRHDCPPDIYSGQYDFAAWPCWRLIWTVSGPRKRLRLTSDYAPLG